MAELSNAERFLNAYSELEHELKRILNLKDHRPFTELVNKGARVNPVIEKHRFDLREYSELRNAIVHDRAGGEIIAEPNGDAVADIEHIARLLLEPPRVLPLFQKKVLTLQIDHPAARAIRELSKLTYTQAPVLENGRVIGLLTLNMIVQWMGLSLAENSFDIEKTSIGELMRVVDHKGSYEIVSADTSLPEIPGLFNKWQNKDKKLEAVLITGNGKVDQPLQGIITNRDLPLIYSELE